MIILNDGTLHEFRKTFVPNIETIAHALAYINRFTGHVGQYSVAQHCVLIAMKLPQELKLSGLLHDAPEAYLGDVSAPLKRLLPDYKKLEAFYHKVIDDHFGVETEHPVIKEYDVRMLVAEGLHFDMPIEHFPNAEPLYLDIKAWEPECAKEAFLSMYYNLTGEARPAAKGEAKFISPVAFSEATVPKVASLEDIITTGFYNFRGVIVKAMAGLEPRLPVPPSFVYGGNGECLGQFMADSKGYFYFRNLVEPGNWTAWSVPLSLDDLESIIARHGVEVDFDNVTQQLESLAGEEDDRYYCICDNKHCGSWYELGKEGDTCSECGSGKLHPQDVDPWE